MPSKWLSLHVVLSHTSSVCCTISPFYLVLLEYDPASQNECRNLHNYYVHEQNISGLGVTSFTCSLVLKTIFLRKSWKCKHKIDSLQVFSSTRAQRFTVWLLYAIQWLTFNIYLLANWLIDWLMSWLTDHALVHL